MNDGDRFNIVVPEIVGKRLTWDQLTGKDEPDWSLDQPEA
jgi:hypothetical protein